MDIYNSKIINNHSAKPNEITEETTYSTSITWYKKSHISQDIKTHSTLTEIPCSLLTKNINILQNYQHHYLLQ